MGLKLWLPLNGSLNNWGLSNATITNNGATINTSGKIGSCYAFDGTQFITIISNDIQNIFQTPQSCFSIACWIYLNSDETDRVIIFGNYSANPFVNWELAANCTQRLAVGGTSNYTNKTNSYVIPKETWTHIGVTYDGNLTTFYVNGILQGAQAGANTLTTKTQTNTFWLGSDNRSGATRLKGKMNDFRIYDHALSVKEVEEISKGLILHYKLDNNGQGQYNLLKDTNKGNYRWIAPSGNGTGTVTSISIDGTNCARYEMTVKSTNWCVFAFRPTNNTEVMDTLHEINSYTLSFDIFPSQPINNAIPRYVDGNAQNNLINWPSFSAPANAWYHYEGTAISSGATQSNQSFYINYLFDIGTYDFKNLKIEIGAKATGYNTHSEESFLSNIIYDSSGYGNNGKIFTPLTLSSETTRYICSTYFNGETSAIKVPYTDIASTDDIFTLNLWFKKDDLGSKNYETLFGGPSGFEMDTRAGSATALTLYMASTRGSNFAQFNFGEWYMITMVNNGTNELYYVNAELKKTIDKKPMPAGNYYIGAWAAETRQNYKGLIADFRIYKTALTDKQIKELYDTSATVDKEGNFYIREVIE